MSRFSYISRPLTVGVVILSSIAAPVAAQKAAAKSAGDARVQHVAVRGTGDATEVVIQTAGATVAPDTQAITGPDRIIVDFPGALPAAELHALALKVNAGALKGVRAGLFFNHPPITRIVLDLAEPQSYQISTANHETVVKLGPAKPGSVAPSSAKVDTVKSDSAKADVAKQDSAKRDVTTQDLAKQDRAAAKIDTAAPARIDASKATVGGAPKLQSALLAAAPKADAKLGKVDLQIETGVASAPVSSPIALIPPVIPQKPQVNVTFVNGMLRIHADKATMAQVLFEVQQRTQAEIAIPAGAEKEQVIADLGPASAREVLAALLNGSPYNFIFVGDEQTLERVILTRRDPDIF